METERITLSQRELDPEFCTVRETLRKWILSGRITLLRDECRLAPSAPTKEMAAKGEGGHFD
jgi:hypothetical protein